MVTKLLLRLADDVSEAPPVPTAMPPPMPLPPLAPAPPAPPRARLAGELPDLLPVAAGAGIDHERDGVVLLLALVMVERLQHDVGNLVGAMRPDVDDFVVALAGGDDTLAILLLNFFDLLLSGVNLLTLFLGNDHVVDADGDASACGLAETQFLQLVEHGHRLVVAANLVTLPDD